jgi:hypothetical protein
MVQALSGSFTVVAGSATPPAAAGYLNVSLEMDDGSKWTFYGGFMGVGIVVAGGPVTVVSSSFPGYQKLAGACMFEIGTGAAFAAGAGVNFHDFINGQLANLALQNKAGGGGVGLVAGVGFGGWTKN